MATLRYRIQQELWAAGVKVGVMLSDSDAPQVTTFPVFVPHGVTMADIDRVLPDIAGRLALPALRCTWRGDGLLELHVPKAKRQAVPFSNLRSSVQDDTSNVLPWLLGVTTRGTVLTADVTHMHHILVSGATGSGKSTAVNASLCWLLSHRTPQQVRTVLFDPKRVDFAALAQAPHNMAHITDMDAAEGVLEALVDDMDKRMALFSRAGVRDIDGYNSKASEPLPRVLVVFDELAAAMDTNGKALEPLLLVLLQKARAAGIHFLLIMQRPDADVLPTRMRNNLTARVTFKLSDPSASRLVHGDTSACDLLGHGDGLLRDVDGVVTRFQSPVATDKDLASAVQAAKRMAVPTYSIDGLDGAAQDVPSFEGLSQFDAAVLLCERLEWISSKDLLEHDIVNSRSQAKKVLSALRDAGHIGGYDPAQNKSPVVMRWSFKTSRHNHNDHPKASKKGVRATNDHDSDRVVN